MILIDKPYVSDFLRQTIKENNLEIISTPAARELIADDSLNWITEEKAKSIYEKNPATRVYTNSENSISWIERNFNSSNLPEQIDIFKDKIKFRELIKDSYPDYFFKGVKFEDLAGLDLKKIKFPVIVKPAVGFFSIGVHKVDNPGEWNGVLTKIEDEIKRLNGLYPKEVIDISDFILEECIEGEEYAIDCYFNKNGDPVILNIFHHIFSSDSDVSDRVYSTSEEIINRHKNGIREFLSEIGLKTNLKNFPAHIEVRIDKKGKLIPIEVNPLRFGGWCTTGDFSWYAYGFNSYEYFLDNKKPDWNEIFRTRKDKKYSLIVLDNISGIKESEIEYFDYDQLLKDFEKPLNIRKVDINKYHIFGFLFIETTAGKDEGLNRILTSTLIEYIKINDNQHAKV
ncbi:MAG TPA: ATP-grasp domain-containing protein [Ignavibacteriaceae bacterium]|nr:ATP-grasp domain-containing protein [Ignavibacteriaceae bacterium]